MDKPQDQGENRGQQDSWKQQQQQQQQQQSGDRQQQQGGMGQSGQQGDARQQQQFDSQGSSQQRGGTGMDNRFADQIREHMEVIDADGQHVGTVDDLDGDRIKLTKSDAGMGGGSGEHRYVPLSQVQGIEDGRVRLSQSGGSSEFGTNADR